MPSLKDFYATLALDFSTRPLLFSVNALCHRGCLTESASEGVSVRPYLWLSGSAQLGFSRGRPGLCSRVGFPRPIFKCFQCLNICDHVADLLPSCTCGLDKVLYTSKHTIMVARKLYYSDNTPNL